MIHEHVHVLVLVLVLVAACNREHREEPARGIACTSDRDCPALPAGAPCAYACGPDVCQLVTIGAHLGDGPCFGNHRDGAQAIAIQAATRVVVACDVNAGLYCARADHHCAAVRSLGAPCTQDDECGADGRCDDDHQTCVAGKRPGEDCRTERCGAGLYCDERARCTSRHALGAACELSDECASFSCDRARCVAAPAPTACPITP